eukprot:TRINITY_DN4005_c0_g1_i1.p1 TRINITY_DN4005_c0_g1~~TRINITY_DN4005_c0_g1_i1.p1  ORF type:complete len:971 (-),score=264.08 TRINITY_DN4005_c0_g1_i1:38-2899(-)
MSSETEWTSQRVRQTFIDFFQNKHEHLFVPSSPVFPYDDPTLLFTNAGMNQFKEIFLGRISPNAVEASWTRACNSQKCIRAGGKHNDLEDVGRDTYHHTFFEMLGNWSFGNYFQEEAIDMAWELLTEVYGLNPKRLYVSYFGGDEEDGLPADLVARDLWRKHLPDNRILPFGKEENFWEMGDVGPCGPCSEIHYDRLDREDASERVNADFPDVIEIWNLVFMQYNREKSGKLTDLPNKHVDTGMGFERLTSLLQDKPSNYDTDVFVPIFDAIQKETGSEGYTFLLGEEDVTKKDFAYRVVADHIRTLTFSICDGALPSKEGRGFVLRRILRRAIRTGKEYLNAEDGFFSRLVDVVVDTFGDFFPELKKHRDLAVTIIEKEEALFQNSLRKGNLQFQKIARSMNKEGNTIISGSETYLLYATYGFPLDLIQLMAEDYNFTVDEEGFEEYLQIDKERNESILASRNDVDVMTLDAACMAELKDMNVDITDEEYKYQIEEINANVLALRVGTSENGSFVEEFSDKDTQLGIILNQTSFYAEEGGQIYDTGFLTTDDFQFVVNDVQKFGGYVLHKGKIITGTVRVGDELTALINQSRRTPITNNHTSTHMVHHALRVVCGEDYTQRGSLVTENQFRFDFASVGSLSVEQLQDINDNVNESIANELPVYTKLIPKDIALKIKGLRSMFGDKYPDPVRVVSVGADLDEVLEDKENEKWANYSIEFCGGTHIVNSKQVQAFTIINELAQSAGERRIVCVTGEDAMSAYEASKLIEQSLSNLEQLANEDLPEPFSVLRKKVDASVIPYFHKIVYRERLSAVYDRITELYKTNLKQKQQEGEELIEELSESHNPDVKYIVQEFDCYGNQKVLNSITQSMSEKLGIVVVLVAHSLDKERYLIKVQSPTSLHDNVKANEIVKHIGAELNGKGGGSNSSAAGFVPDSVSIDDILNVGLTFVEERF